MHVRYGYYDSQYSGKFIHTKTLKEMTKVMQDLKVLEYIYDLQRNNFHNDNFTLPTITISIEAQVVGRINIYNFMSSQGIYI